MITAGVAIQIAFLAAVILIWLMIAYQVVMTAGGFLHRLRSARLTADLLRVGGTLPSVSILIPARNEELVIRETLRAVCSLSYPQSLEILVIDDGSTDRTAELVEEVATSDRRVRLLRLPLAEQGRGKSSAVNHARPHATHELPAVHDPE